MTSRNLHIAMVVRSFSPHGGLELYAHRLVEGLLRRGVSVTVICEETADVLAHPNLQIVGFDPAKPWMRKAQRLRHYYVAASKAVCDHGPFDLVHSHQIPIAQPDVVTFHNHTLRRMCEVGTALENLFNRTKKTVVPAYRLRDMYDRELCLNARCLVFPSQRCRDDYYQTFGSRGELCRTPSVVAYPGTDPDTIAAKDPPAGEADRNVPTFLFIGKGFRKKGLNVLLEACRLLSSRNRKFQLLIAGVRPRLLDKITLKLSGLDQQVTYLGYLSNLDGAFKESDIFVMPSRLEAFGIACIQAMQRGLAPIVSRVAGASELLVHGQDALILEDHLDAQALSVLMEQLSDDFELRLKLSNSAQQVAASTTWDGTVEATLHAYQLARSSPSTPRLRNINGACL